MSFKQFLAETKKYSYSSLMIELPDMLTDSVISWGFDHIPSEEVFSSPHDPSFGREDNVHITVLYGINSTRFKDVAALFEHEKPFECRLGKLSLLTANRKFDVLIINVDCDALYPLNAKLKRNLDVTENHLEFIPHVTIAYLNKDVGEKYEGIDEFKDETFTVDKVIFSAKSGLKTPIKLGAK